MAKKVPLLPVGDVADSDDMVLYVSSGAVKLVPMRKLPVSTAVADAVALRVDAATVQALIGAAVADAKDRSQQTGNMPAANAVLSSGQTVEDAIAQLRQLVASPSAPVITSDPTISGTAAVGNTLTATPGSVTEGLGGSHTNRWQWYVVDAVDQVAIAGATSNTLAVTSAYTGKRLLVAQIAVDSSGLPSAARSSAATAVVTATPPSNTVLPAITPSGTQAVGTTLTCSTGTWSNATGATYAYQWLLGGAAISGATSNTYVPINGQEGASITCRVTATTAQGSASAVSSNTITVSGTPTLTNLTAPAFPSTVTVGVAATITNSTWTGGTPTLALTRIYVDSATTPYAQISSNPAIYTPEQDGSTFLLNQTGLTTLAGHTVYCDQQVTFNGTTYTSPKSPGKVVQAPAATLAARIDATGLSWTQGTAITSVRPVTGTGGTSPYTYAISPALPAGLSFNTSTGFISGTPTVTSSLITYTVTVTDAAAATASATFTASVASASVTPLASAFQAGAVYGWEAPNDADSTGYAEHEYTNGLSVPPLSNVPTITRGGIVRGGPTTVDGLPVLRHAIYPSDPLRYSGHRAELTYDSTQIDHGNDYWMSFALKLDSDWTAANGGGSSDRQSLMQVHQQGSGASYDSPPMGFQWVGNAGAELNLVTVGPPNGDATVTTRFTTAATPGAWQRFILHYRSGVTAGQSPLLEMWVANGAGAYTKLTDQAPGTLFGDPTAAPHDWAKIGLYKWTSGVYGSTTKRGMYSSGLFFGKGMNLYNEAAAAIAAFGQ